MSHSPGQDLEGGVQNKLICVYVCDVTRKSIGTFRNMHTEYIVCMYDQLMLKIKIQWCGLFSVSPDLSMEGSVTTTGSTSQRCAHN